MFLDQHHQLMNKEFLSSVQFQNIIAQRRCSNLPSLGKRSIMTNIDHSVRKISAPQPKKYQNSRSSVALVTRSFFVRMVIPYLPCSPQSIIFDCFCTLSSFVLVVVVVVVIECSVSMDVVIIVHHHEPVVVCLCKQKNNLQTIMGATNGWIVLCHNV